MIIAVGSTNPTKIDPVRDVFSKHFQKVTVQGIEIKSSVKEQPIGDDEIYKGALHRAKEAIKNVNGADYGVGIEGGMVKRSFGWMEYSLVVIVDKKGNVGIGSSGSLVLPDCVIKRIHKGETLEQSIDALFGTKKIGKGIGMFGVMTKGTVTRTSGVSHGVAFALARFLHPTIYQK
jgi:inosine/xanthosine triphosphatase